MASRTTPPTPDFFTTDEVATLLGKHPASVRRWRTLNKKEGAIRYGPPYEFRGANVVYPKDAFRQWCGQVVKVNGIPRLNLPVSAVVPLPQRSDQRSTVTNADVASEAVCE